MDNSKSESGINVDEHQRKSAVRLFNEYIYPHIIGDLKILDNIQPITHGNGCAVPTAMLILSSLDLFGYLLKSDGKQDSTHENIRFALEYEKYFPEEYNSIAIDKLILYRTGMMHSFYPRQTSKDVYCLFKSDSKVLFEEILLEGRQVISLNVNVLSDDFKTFVDNLYNEIKTTNNTAVLENMYKGFKIRYPEISISLTTSAETTTPYGVMKNK